MVWEDRTGDFASLLVSVGKKKVHGVREEAAPYAAHEQEAQEASRAHAQRVADTKKSSADRNRLGQFSTPFPVAFQMVGRALKALPSDVPITFLEPALGSGVFFSALLRHASPARIASARGCEIDSIYGDIAHAIWARSGLRVVPCDFVSFAAKPENFRRFSLLCTNPPYVRHHHLPAARKVELQSLVMQRLGLQVSGLSGLYVYFVLLADAVLAHGAMASLLVPAELLYVNYGRVLRDYLQS